MKFGAVMFLRAGSAVISAAAILVTTLMTAPVADAALTPASAAVNASSSVATGSSHLTGSASRADRVVPSFPNGTTRLSGANRYDTALTVSQSYPAGVSAVFVATGQNFPDALSAAAAAASIGGPLLLTPTATLPANVHAEIKRLKPKRIYIAGGTGAVSAKTQSTLSSIAPVTRLGGVSRYETGNKIVDSTFSSSSHAFIATGRTFPDALAATGAAGSLSAPVILVDGEARKLSADTRALLKKLKVEHITIVGGTGAVSADIENQLAASYTTHRIGGASRYETATNINDEFFRPMPVSAAFLSTGQNFPDALAGAALAGHMKSPIYITTAGCVPEVAHNSLLTLAAPATVVLGGSSVVSNNAAANKGCLTASTPKISGTVRVGSRLTAQPGAWTSGTAFKYQWLANGTAISGATASTLTLTSGMAKKKISVRVTGSKSGYVTASATSRATAAVATPTRTQPIDSWNCPTWAPIKGNASSMIYHIPSGAFYTKTNPEECFSTEAAARAAGYRKSKL